MFLRTMLRNKETIMSELMLEVGEAQELKLALREARASDGSEWTNGDVKTLSNPSILGSVLDYIRGRAEIVAKGLLVVVKSFMIAATAEKRTVECFTDKTWYAYRDSDLDGLLKVQGAQPEGKITVNQLSRPAKFVEMVQGLLCIMETNLAVLSRMAIEAGYLFTLTQIEMLVECQEDGKDTGLLTNGRANFFLVPNREESVSVVGAYRDGRRWDVLLYPLDDGGVWGAEFRFFSLNKTL